MRSKEINSRKNCPLHDGVQAKIRRMIIGHRLVPGARIIESRLSTQLGVSRTPLREALFKLEQEGFIKSDLARGFTVNDLSAQEVKELYPIVWTLEALALRLAEPHIGKVVKELKSINREFAGAIGSPEKTIAIDTHFHETLTNQCRNRHLIDQLISLRQLIVRYEFAYMQDANWPKESYDQHNEIINAITKMDLNHAITLIEQNWRCGMERISTWLEWTQAEERRRK